MGSYLRLLVFYKVSNSLVCCLEITKYEIY